MNHEHEGRIASYSCLTDTIEWQFPQSMFWPRMLVIEHWGGWNDHYRQFSSQFHSEWGTDTIQGGYFSIPAKSPSISYNVYLLIFSFHFGIELKLWIYHVSNVLQWKIKIWQFWPNYDYGLVNTAGAGAVMKLFQHESDANSALIPQLVLFAPIQH